MSAKMTSADCKNLINETMDKIGIIQTFEKEIETIRESCKTTDDLVNSEVGLLSKIKNASLESDKFLDNIIKAHKSICEDAEGENSYQTLIEQIYGDLAKQQDKVDGYIKTLFGETQKSETGEITIPGLSQKVGEFFEKNQKKMEDLITDAETRLTGSVTSVELAETFSIKVKEYKSEGLVWSRIFLGVICVLVIYFMWATRNNTDASDPWQVWTLILYRLPLLGFGIWLLGFIGNRRAEAKKLEESYKHKEVLARSYVGYRRSVDELSTDDNKLLENLMKNLLEAMNQDSGRFLSSEGEKHPFFSLLGGMFGGKTNDTNNPG